LVILAGYCPAEFITKRYGVSTIRSRQRLACRT